MYIFPVFLELPMLYGPCSMKTRFIVYLILVPAERTLCACLAGNNVIACYYSNILMHHTIA